MKKNLAIAQAVSRRLPTAAARFLAQVRLCGICGGQSGTGTGFLRVFLFPLTIRIPPTAPHSSSSVIPGWYNRPVNGRLVKVDYVSFHSKNLKEIRHENEVSVPCSIGGRQEQTNKEFSQINT
jgi:hypothetical protein